jgi:hypothetical protein
MSFIASQPGGNNGPRLNLDRLREARLRLQQEQPTPPPLRTPVAASTGFSTAQAAALPIATPQVRPTLTPELLQHEAQQALAKQASAPLKPAPPLVQMNQAIATPNPLPLEGRFGLPLQDIQHVAQASGFIGISQENIERAYLKGQSLLVDYRV